MYLTYDTTSKPKTNQQQIAAHGAPIQASLFADGFEDGFGAWTSLEGGRNESITVRLFYLSLPNVRVEMQSVDRPNRWNAKPTDPIIDQSINHALLPKTQQIAKGGPARAGQASARINVIPSDFAHHGNRAEITHNLEDGPGTVLRCVASCIVGSIGGLVDWSNGRKKVYS